MTPASVVSRVDSMDIVERRRWDMGAGTAVGERFVEAMGARDYTRVRDLLDPAAHLRALIPPGPFELDGSREIADRFGSWFGDAAACELVSSAVDEVADRVRITYRLRVRHEAGADPVVVEQTAFCDIQSGKVVALDLLCSGFRDIAGT
jgi:hypothetical protein